MTKTSRPLIPNETSQMFPSLLEESWKPLWNKKPLAPSSLNEPSSTLALPSIDFGLPTQLAAKRDSPLISYTQNRNTPNQKEAVAQPKPSQHLRAEHPDSGVVYLRPTISRARPSGVDFLKKKTLRNDLEVELQDEEHTLGEFCWRPGVPVGPLESNPNPNISQDEMKSKALHESRTQKNFNMASSMGSLTYRSRRDHEEKVLEAPSCSGRSTSFNPASSTARMEELERPRFPMILPHRQRVPQWPEILTLRREELPPRQELLPRDHVDIPRKRKWKLVSAHDNIESLNTTSDTTISQNSGLKSHFLLAFSKITRKLLGDLYLPEGVRSKAKGPVASGDSGSSSQISDSSAQRVSTSGTANRGGTQKRRRDPGKDSDKNNDDSDDNDEGRRRRKCPRGLKKPEGIAKRLKCPYYQMNPIQHTRNACRGAGFADMAKLKDHLKRVHSRPIQCPRCWTDLPSEHAYTKHLVAEPICLKVLPPNPNDDRISVRELQGINFNRYPFAQNQSVEEKWKTLFQMLFPDAGHIPSPYEEPGLNENFDRLLAETLEEELTKELVPALGPAVSRIRGRLAGIIQLCKKRAFEMSSKKNKAHPSNSSGSCGRATPSTGSDLGPLSLLDRDEGAHQLSLVQDNRGGIASRPASAGKAPLPNNDHFEVVRPLGFPPTAEDTPPLSMFDREEQPKAEVANSLSTSWILVEDHSETYEPDARKLSDAEHQWEFSVENGAKGKYLFHLPGEYPFPLKPDIDFDSLSDDIYTQFLHFD